MRLPQIFTKTSYLNRTTVVYDLVRKKYQTFNKIYEIKEACTHNYTMYIICTYLYSVLPIKVVSMNVFNIILQSAIKQNNHFLITANSISH